MISDLQLNFPKTVYVPLEVGGPLRLAPLVVSRVQYWAGMSFSHKAKFLGFVLGPARGHDTYDKPPRNYEQRAAAWGAAGGGLFLTTLAYAVYVFQFVQFVTLDRPPPHGPRVERVALRRLVFRPGNWCHFTVLCGLHLMGFRRGGPRSADHDDSIPHHSSGGLHARDRAASLRSWHQRSDNFFRRAARSVYSSSATPWIDAEPWASQNVGWKPASPKVCLIHSFEMLPIVFLMVGSIRPVSFYSPNFGPRLRGICGDDLTAGVF